RHLVDALEDLDVEWVGDIAGDDPDQRAPAAAQPACQEVRLVAEAGSGSQHTVPSLIADGDTRGAPVQDARSGRDRDAGPLGDVAQRGRGWPPATSGLVDGPGLGLGWDRAVLATRRPIDWQAARSILRPEWYRQASTFNRRMCGILRLDRRGRRRR